MDKLVALPVYGDSFLLFRAGRTILVDGGSTGVRLATELAKYSVRHLDIVVCTHADADHAGGLVDILDKSTITIGEFWLPGAWGESLPDLISDPAHVVNTLVSEIETANPLNDLSDHDHASSLEARLYAKISSAKKRMRRENRSAEGPPDIQDGETHQGLDWLKRMVAEVTPILEGEGADAGEIFDDGRAQIHGKIFTQQINRRLAFVWIDLIDTAERILKIALQAIRHDVPIRWFDFGEFDETRQASGGDAGLLVPLNAVELSTPPAPIQGMTYLLQLSQPNEECLVFLSPSQELQVFWNTRTPSVVFTGDSPLGDGADYSVSWLDWPKSASRFVIATAPHHGSDKNAWAYEHLNEEVHVALWVRSGGSWKHPGLTYQRIPPWQRICTNCPHEDLKARAVEVDMCSGFNATGHTCIC